MSQWQFVIGLRFVDHDHGQCGGTGLLAAELSDGGVRSGEMMDFGAVKFYFDGRLQRGNVC